MGDLSKCLPITLKFEGGWSDNPHDPGGATMRGVTLATFRRYAPGATKEQLRAISSAMLLTIYRDGYWNPIGGDNLPPGVDLAAFDYAVNSGPCEARKAIAIAAGASPVERVKAICARRMLLLQSLKTWRYFGKGWTSRVNQIRIEAIKMAGGPEARAELTKAASEEQAAASKKKKASAGAIAGAAIAAQQGVAPAAATHAALGTGGTAALVLAGVVLAGLAVWLYLSKKKHEDAAAALTEAARGA